MFQALRTVKKLVALAMSNSLATTKPFGNDYKTSSSSFPRRRESPEALPQFRLRYLNQYKLL